MSPQVLLCGFIVFWSPGSVLQVALGILVCLGSLMLTLSTAPYLRRGDDVIAGAALLSLLLTLFGALLLKVELPPHEALTSDALATLLVVIAVAPMVLFIGAVLFEQCFTRLRVRQERKAALRGRREQELSSWSARPTAAASDDAHSHASWMDNPLRDRAANGAFAAPVGNGEAKHAPTAQSMGSRVWRIAGRG